MKDSGAEEYQKRTAEGTQAGQTFPPLTGRHFQYL